MPPALAIIPDPAAPVVLTADGLTMLRLQIVGRFDTKGWGVSTPGLHFLPWGIALSMATLAYYCRRRGRGPTSRSG